MSNNWKSALCYFPYIGFLWAIYILMTEKTDQTARFNAIQGLCLLLALDIISWVIAVFLFWVPLINWILPILIILLEVYLLYKTYKGDDVILPLIGPFAKDHA